MCGDLPSVYRDNQVIARKPHQCCECKRIIHTKETYNRFTGCWEGKWDTFVTCEECDELRREIHSDLGCYNDGPGFGDLREWAHDLEIEFPIKSKLQVNP